MKQQSRSPTLAELIRLALKTNQAEIHVSTPGRIEKYDSAKQTADIQPLLRRTLVAVDGTELAPETLPILHDVPIAFPRGGGYFLSWPLQPGDLVHLVFIERSIDQYIGGDGAETTPLDFRMHSLSDAVAYPGLYPHKRALSSAHSENAVLGSDDGVQIHITPDGEIHLGSDGAADYVALAALVKSELEALQSTVSSLVTTFNGHTHPYVDTPVGASATSVTTTTGTPPSAVSDVAAGKVKAD